MGCLPWQIGGEVRPGTDGGATLVELIALLAMSRDAPEKDSTGETVDDPTVWGTLCHDVISVGLVQQFAIDVSAGHFDAMSRIVAATRSREVWLRNATYPTLLRETLLNLFSGSVVSAQLTTTLGFDAATAIVVLETCHKLQAEMMLDRLHTAFEAVKAGIDSGPFDAPDPQHVEAASIAWHDGWTPSPEKCTVAFESIAESAGLSVAVVGSVLNHFAVDVQGKSARDLAQRFLTGDSPWRTSPVVVSPGDRAMVLHDALTLPAIRENLEGVLKETPAWEAYQRGRAKYLEDHTLSLISEVLPDARTWSGFEYFVKADSGGDDPFKFSKLVEGDVLIVQDDVAFIIEAKAVALSSKSRAGHSRRLRSDLAKIVTNAAEQAGRLREEIELRRGLRLRDDTWVDLSKVREVHTIAVSLEDLSGIATTTADLLAEGLLRSDEIPWTVSIHDLALVCELVEHPAELLLYLRRRRDPEATLAYSATDELDYFLYFYAKGLYVPFDPVKAGTELPHLRDVRPGDARRRRRTRQTFITSHTDPLDAWFYYSRGVSPEPASKPSMAASPIQQLLDEIQELAPFAWLSTCATLLSGSTKTQSSMSKYASRLLASPKGDGTGRSITVPIGSTREDAWLLVWCTVPEHADWGLEVERLQSYLDARKYDLGIRRGSLLMYRESDRQLASVLYSGLDLEPNAEYDEALRRAGLAPPDRIPSMPPPVKKKRKKKSRR